MEFKEAMRTLKRMCDVRDGCEKCELELNCPFVTVSSNLNFDKAEAALEKWAKEHPEKTIADDFFEKHPKAPRRNDDTPHVCAIRCGYTDACPEYESVPECDKCWRQPLEEVE